MHLLAVAANDIDTSGVSLNAELPVAWLNQELHDVGATVDAPGRVAARLSRSGGDIVVRGQVDAKLSLSCARCLGPALVDVSTELTLLLRPAVRADVPVAVRGAVGAKPSARGESSTGASAPRSRASSERASSGSHRGNGASRGASGDHAVGKGGASVRAAGAERDHHASENRRRSKESEYEFSSEEADVDTFDGETVVLDSFVREAIVLELPNFPLCSEACPGIGPVASAPLADSVGSSERVDPRLAPLEALREKLRKTSKTEAIVTEPEVEQAIRVRPGSRAAARPLLRSSSAATKTKKKKKRNKE